MELDQETFLVNSDYYRNKEFDVIIRTNFPDQPHPHDNKILTDYKYIGRRPNSVALQFKKIIKNNNGNDTIDIRNIIPYTPINNHVNLVFVDNSVAEFPGGKKRRRKTRKMRGGGGAFSSCFNDDNSNDQLFPFVYPERVVRFNVENGVVTEPTKYEHATHRFVTRTENYDYDIIDIINNKIDTKRRILNLLVNELSHDASNELIYKINKEVDNLKLILKYLKSKEYYDEQTFNTTNPIVDADLLELGDGVVRMHSQNTIPHARSLRSLGGKNRKSKKKNLSRSRKKSRRKRISKTK